jgi:hypothetical protein
MAQNEVNIFGKPGSAMTAQRILSSPVLNANPSPANPQTVPTNEVSKHYARLLYAAYEIRKVEKDPLRLGELHKVIEFADRVYSQLALNPDEVSEFGPPGTPQQPAMPGAAPAAPSPMMQPPQQAGPVGPMAPPAGP